MNESEAFVDDDSGLERRILFKFGGMVAFGCFLILLDLCGNLLLILTFLKEPKLQALTNYWIVSMAFTDLLLGLVVMPIAIASDATGGHWLFGLFFCDVFIALDVLCCTCSIYHLVVISVDRFFCVRFPLSYPKNRTRRSTLLTITAIWFVCTAISMPRLLGWKSTKEADPEKCQLESLSYMVFSSIVSFYLPLVLIIATYSAMFQITRAHSAKLSTPRFSIQRRFSKAPEKLKQTFDSSKSYNDTSFEEASMPLNEPANKPCKTALQNGSAPKKKSSYLVPPVKHPRTRNLQNRPRNENNSCPRVQPKSSCPPMLDMTVLSGHLRRSSTLPIETKITSPVLAGSIKSETGNDDEWNSPTFMTGLASESNSSYALSATLPQPGSESPSSESSRIPTYQYPPLMEQPPVVPIQRERRWKGPKLRQMLTLSPKAFHKFSSPFPRDGHKKSSAAASAVSGVSAPSRLERTRRRQERRAGRIIAIVVFSFVACWMPFFVANVADPFCHCVYPGLWRALTWLGYANSALNPVIYTAFNRTFRQAVLKLLGCPHLVDPGHGHHAPPHRK